MLPIVSWEMMRRWDQFSSEVICNCLKHGSWFLRPGPGGSEHWHLQSLSTACYRESRLVGERLCGSLNARRRSRAVSKWHWSPGTAPPPLLILGPKYSLIVDSTPLASSWLLLSVEGPRLSLWHHRCCFFTKGSLCIKLYLCSLVSVWSKRWPILVSFCAELGIIGRV